jgi:hypothetical protein
MRYDISMTTMIDSAFHSKLQDEQYLFRISSTFAWDEAIEFCYTSILGIEAADAATLSSSAAAAASAINDTMEYFDEHLDTHFNNNQNETQVSLHQLIAYIYKQITFSDQWGNTPLHSACFCKPPVDMIMALFRLARALRRFSSRAASTTHVGTSNHNTTNDATTSNLIIWAATCKDGSTPFLIASSTGASTEVLHCYLDEIQYYIDNDWINKNNPKEWARKTVIRPDFSGITPLMGWMSYHDKWIKRQLDPSSRYPQDFLSDYWELNQRMLQFATKNDHLDDDDDYDSNQQQTTSTYTLVKQCASISLYCPIALLEWVVSPHRQGIVDNMSSQSVPWIPADICASTPDRRTGKLLFHIAMEARPFLFDSTSIIEGGGDEKAVRYTANNHRLEKNRIQMIQKLLKWFPDAANVPFHLMKKCCVANNKSPSASASAAATTTTATPYSDQREKVEKIIRSRSPFLQAIALGGSWWHSLTAASDCNEDHDDDNNMGLVQVLWRLNPGETSKSDKVSGLYPFMLAATTATRMVCCDNSDELTLVIDTMYNLLRKDPELVTRALMTMKKSDG